jgi:hypothetical protein
MKRLMTAALAGSTLVLVAACGGMPGSADPAIETGNVTFAAAGLSSKQFEHSWTHQEKAPGPSTATFIQWWDRGGREQYTAVANDLWKVIITDGVRDQDKTFLVDSLRLSANTRAAMRNPPPVDPADWLSAMRTFKAASQAAVTGRYGQTFNLVKKGLRPINSFSKKAGLSNASFSKS